MEFKVFKNENNKILKEYWLTQSEWDALDKTTVQEGDIYHIVGTIDKGDLSADVNASLAKADSSLQKPTTTLAKESFVKVGIDGSQKFDENSYVIAPSTDGTVGQVLKKTATGTEWANESGGSGGGKLYLHYIIGSVNESSSFSFNVCLYTSSSEPINSNDKAFNVLNIGENQNRVIIGFFNGNKKYCCGVKFDKSLSAPAIRIEYLSETGNNISKEANINNDFVTEL